MYIKVTVAQYNPKSDTWSLSDSKVRHNADSAMKLLARRGYSLDSAMALLNKARRLASV